MDLARPMSPVAVRPAGPTDARQPLLARLVLAVVLLLPLNLGWVLWAGPGGAGDYNRRVTIAPFDFALVALVLVWIGHRRRVGFSFVRPTRPTTWRSCFHGGEGAVLAAAFAVVFTISFAAHPSWRGVEYALRLLGAVALVDVVRRSGPADRRRTSIAFAAAGAFEALLAIAQAWHGRGFALSPIDQAGPLFSFGATHAGRGGLSHPYHLAVYLLVALFAAVRAGRTSTGRERHLWMLATACLGAGLAVTFSRAMVLALVPVAVLWGVERRRRIGPAVRPLLAALVAGFAITALVFGSGWTTRAAQSTGSGADRGRVTLARAGLEMAADSPFTGVGPARYVLALDEPGPPDGELLPAHNVVVHAAAELGIAGAVVVSVIGLWSARRVTRRGALAAGGLWLLAPFFLLDAYPYVFPTGIALAALWIGLLETPDDDQERA